jgi:hypothetical protein
MLGKPTEWGKKACMIQKVSAVVASMGKKKKQIQRSIVGVQQVILQNDRRIKRKKPSCLLNFLLH